MHLKKINNKISFSVQILCFTIFVLLLLNYSCTFFASGSYPMAEWYNIETSFIKLDSNINLFKSKYPQYDVIVRNDDNSFSSMDKIHNNYKSYYFYFSDIQLTILCVVENDTISNHKNTAIGLVRIIESPGYISTDITHQDINLHLSKKANNAIKAKFEKEILEHIGNWEKISSSKKNYWGKNKNSSFTKKIIKSIKKQESVISYDSIKWTTINLQESLGNDYDTLYLFSNSSKKQIENIIGIPYQQGDFWSKETYLILLKKGKHIVYREEISRFPYFENIYINFNIPQRNKKLPNCILKSGNPNYFIKIENLNGENFYLLYNAKDSLSIHPKHIWDK